MNAGLVLIISLCILMFSGIPVAVSLCAAGLITMRLCMPEVNMISFAQKLFGGLNSFPMLAIIFFMVSGELMLQGGLSKRIVNVAKVFLSKIRGALALISFVACALFGAMCGSGIATTSAIGSLMYPEMKADGTYDNSFSLACQAVGGTLGQMIPPSTPLIIYALASNASVPALFAGVLVPGITVCLAYCIVGYFVLKKRNMGTRRYEKPERKPGEKSMVVDALWALMTPVILLGGIYSGIFSPTESAAVACLYAWFVGTFIYKELPPRAFYNAMVKSVIGTAAMMFLCTSANYFGWVLTYSGESNRIVNMIITTVSSKYVFLFIVDLLILFAGMFVDAATIILLLVPLLAPAASQLGVDLIHFGVVFAVGVSVGNISPPFGTCLFVANGMQKDMPISKIYREVMPFVIVAALLTILYSYLPGFCTLFS